jgi:DnaJ-class molecular chaperone
MATPYETLGVASNASQDEIRKAYRKLAKETHPDLNPGKPVAEARFKEINAAYDIVGDAEKRKRYDAGEIDATGAERQQQRHYYREYAEADQNARYRRAHASASNRDDAGDIDDDLFANLFGGRNRSERFRAPPQDLRYALEIDFLDAVNGSQKRVTMPDGKMLDIAIPAGISNGQVLRLKGQGLPGSDDKPGDAYVEISVRPHPEFTREGDDITSTLPVSLGEALNGANIRVETIGGRVDVKVPRGAKEGTRMRLRGKGVVRGKSGEHGDHFITIHIVPPEGADDALAKFIGEWEQKNPQHPRKQGVA